MRTTDPRPTNSATASRRLRRSLEPEADFIPREGGRAIVMMAHHIDSIPINQKISSGKSQNSWSGLSTNPQERRWFMSECEWRFRQMIVLRNRGGHVNPDTHCLINGVGKACSTVRLKTRRTAGPRLARAGLAMVLQIRSNRAVVRASVADRLDFLQRHTWKLIDPPRATVRCRISDFQLIVQSHAPVLQSRIGKHFANGRSFSILADLCSPLNST